MAEHSELISEMPFLEKLNTEERLKLARKRRSQQMKKCSQREKEYGLSKRKRQDENDSTNKKNSGYKVHFDCAVMLLEAATRYKWLLDPILLIYYLTLSSAPNEEMILMKVCELKSLFTFPLNVVIYSQTIINAGSKSRFHQWRRPYSIASSML